MLCTLPEEILLKITCFVVGETRHEDWFSNGSTEPDGVTCKDRGLASLASVDHRLRRICLPVMFAEVEVRIRRHERDVLHNILLNFLTMLLRRPHLAALIL
jgi:hypothetical protein